MFDSFRISPISSQLVGRLEEKNVFVEAYAFLWIISPILSEPLLPLRGEKHVL